MSVAALLRQPAFRQGVTDMLGTGLGVGAWGLVTGVAMVRSGLDPWLALLMSLTVYAGSSQLASLPLIAAGAPIWVVLLTGFVVNLRFVIYSAQWRFYFGHLPRWLAAPEIAAGRLVDLPLAETRQELPINIAWRSRQVGRALAWFLDRLADEATRRQLTTGI